MTDFNGFKGRAKRIDDIDLPKLGSLIGVGEDEIHAFLDAETKGKGFDSQGRPRILFERHIFYRRLSGSKRDLAVKQGLANPKPGGYGKESIQYSKLEKAMKIDVDAALESCSWGLAQVMGYNHVDAGYNSIDEFVLAMMDDEENHLWAAINFIKSNHLDDELQKHNWAGFARGYNGPNYRINKYDEKLAAAYAKWAKIKDTPYEDKEVLTQTPPLERPKTSTKVVKIETTKVAEIPGLDKSIFKSKQAWAAVGTFFTSLMATLSSPSVQIALLVLIACFAAFIVWDRRKKSQAQRNIKNAYPKPVVTETMEE